MIKEAFLISCLAMPVGMIPSRTRNVDVSVFRFMVNHYRKFHGLSNGGVDRVYMVGGSQAILESLLDSSIEAWRIMPDCHTPFDIVAFPNAIPLARESSLVVIYGLTIKYGPWESMKLWIEATGPLAQGGIIAFSKDWVPHFPKIARARGYESIGFDWYSFQLWRKPEAVRMNGRLSVMEGAA